MAGTAKGWQIAAIIFFIIFAILGIVFSSLTGVLTDPCPDAYYADGQYYTCYSLDCEDIYAEIHPCDCGAYCYTPPISTGGAPLFMNHGGGLHESWQGGRARGKPELNSTEFHMRLIFLYLYPYSGRDRGHRHLLGARLYQLHCHDFNFCCSWLQ